MRLPDVIGVGPPRTGSTWLYNALRDAVDMPEGVKEPQFFSTFYDKGIDWYARHFRNATGKRPVGEISPPYFFHADTPERVKIHIPNCKIVATMRNPVDRIYSVYKLMRHYGWVRRGTLDEVLQTRPDLGGGNRYASHLETWFDTFGRENVLVTMYDELRDDPQEYLNRVCDFIGVTANCARAARRSQRRRELVRSRTEESPARGRRVPADVLAQGTSGLRTHQRARKRRRVGVLRRTRRAISASYDRTGRALARALHARSRGA